MATPRKSSEFPPTRWTWVQEVAGDEPEAAASALSHLCDEYWYPVYSFIRREGRSPEDAEDFTQGFFAALITSGGLGAARKSRGRFRSFLLASLKHYLVDEHRKTETQKRGGRVMIVSIDQNEAEERYHAEPVADGLDPESAFARQWAETLMASVHDVLRVEFAERGKEALFEAMEPFLPWNATSDGQGPVADALGMKLNTFRSHVFHLRRRYAETLREKISETVATEDEIDDEIRFLKNIFTT